MKKKKSFGLEILVNSVAKKGYTLIINDCYVNIDDEKKVIEFISPKEFKKNKIKPYEK